MVSSPPGVTLPFNVAVAAPTADAAAVSAGELTTALATAAVVALPVVDEPPAVEPGVDDEPEDEPPADEPGVEDPADEPPDGDEPAVEEPADAAPDEAEEPGEVVLAAGKPTFASRANWVFAAARVVWSVASCCSSVVTVSSAC